VEKEYIKKLTICFYDRIAMIDKAWHDGDYKTATALSTKLSYWMAAVEETDAAAKSDARCRELLLCPPK
jgi:hypothetical protein